MKRIFALLSLVFTPFAASAADITEGLPVIGAPSDWGWKLIETAGPISEEMTWFHNDFIMPIITAITLFVIGLLGFILIRFSRKANPKPATFTHNTLIEIIWTVIPILIVVAIIVPSMKLLFKVDKIEEADLTLKITGMSAWYWSYDYPEYGIEELESRLKPEEELVEGDLRLLEVDEPLVLPVGKNIKILVTAEPLGMIHSWGVSSLKVKRDAIPGRINEGWFRIEEPGIYYGQCYELCGPGHAYMPIKVVAVEEDKFNEWVLTKGGKLPGGDLIKVAEEETKQGEL